MRRRAFLKSLTASVLVGCGKGSGSGSQDLLTWGGLGQGNGQFRSPRAIGVLNDEVYVIDKTGRIQVFDVEGKFLRSWSTPAQEKGTPTSISFDKQGKVLIPDTHYSQILEYDTQGKLLIMWGSYGTGQDNFIYPTGIVQSADGSYYLSEYGQDAERVHVFDKDRRFVRQWGSQGDGDEQFSRAMGIAIDSNQRVCVADTGNHRVQIFDQEGKFLMKFGGIGDGPGKLKFPEGISIAPDGSIFVCEYGNHRVSRFTKDGEFINSFGRAGRSPGDFNSPRGVAVGDSWLFVADTDNHRVERLKIKDLG